MSTTFGVQIPNDEIIEVAFRCNGIRFTNPLAQLLPDNTPLIPLDNSSQGIETIGDIKLYLSSLEDLKNESELNSLENQTSEQ